MYKKERGAIGVSILPHRERISRVLLMMAGEHREVSVMTAGSIAAVVGLKHVSKCHIVSCLYS